MRIAIIATRHAEHQVAYSAALRAGITVAGDEAEVFASDSEYLQRADEFRAVCCWGWRRGMQFRAMGRDVLVMERAYIGDRYRWVSLGWNGLNGRATWPDRDDPSRWEQHFGGTLTPWRRRETREALLMGQVPTDTACRGINLHSWLSNVAQRLRTQGMRVVFRPHPKAPPMTVPGTELARRGNTLEEDLSTAAFAVAFNSNSCVDAVLAGVPTVSYDQGCMAWDVTSHSVDERRLTPSREPWAHRMAWRQWLAEEISAGLAWPVVREALGG